MIDDPTLRACLASQLGPPRRPGRGPRGRDGLGHDLTGIAGPADNEKGLDDARRWLQ